MNEEVLKAVIRAKCQVGSVLLKELPTPVQTTVNTVLETLKEELESYLEQTNITQDTKGRNEIKSVIID
ncbi:DUF3926 domain-containing protein [Bacillus sp. 165]|uniref:DUF3926 domain-containing protein n=1 Tax=Bacillus sp. 165 TaxID=1529117 RepID=UPI001ADB301E|nr:DUF3926 domain-containing protein [Bacillus sp. 165]MBO9131257.1 DUF3926 domain-containing protein [Bacillus sp. 165]